MTIDARRGRGLRALMTAALIGPLALVAALALGWNSPRPLRPPDEQAEQLPRDVKARPGEMTVLLLNHVDGDVGLEIEALPIAGPASGFNGYGLVFQAQDAESYHVLAVGGDGYYAVLRFEEGNETPLVPWQQFPHVRRGWQANRLRIACANARCDCYINDEYAVTIELDKEKDPVTGEMGLWVRSFEGEGVTARFLSLRIWQAPLAATGNFGYNMGGGVVCRLLMSK